MVFEHLSKNKKALFILFGIFVIGGLCSYWFYSYGNASDKAKIEKENEVAAVRSLVEDFGRFMKNVSLLSPTVTQEIDTNYKNFVDPALLEQWKNDPSKAVGRQTSSPWPDSIEISDIKQFGSGAYDVSGKIIDMTSTGMSGSRPVEIGVVKFGNRWLITGISVNASQEKR